MLNTGSDRSRCIRRKNPCSHRRQISRSHRCRNFIRGPREAPPVTGGGDKEVVSAYFTNDGFQRWKKIYGVTDDVNKVQLAIRIGHAKTVENVMKMLTDEGSLRGVSVCDAGCRTRLLFIPLDKEGVIVSVSDISSSMVSEAQKQVNLSTSNR